MAGASCGTKCVVTLQAKQKGRDEESRPLLFINTALRLRGCADRPSADAASPRRPRGEQRR